MVTETSRTAAQKEQEFRDLSDQLSGVDRSLSDGEQPEIVLKETSPRVQKETVYSMIDGEPVRIPRKLLRQTLQKRIPKTDKYLFTANKEEAPEYKRGEIKCFLHPEAPEHELLAQIGMADKVCMSGNLASGYSKRIHGLHRHKDEWAALQEYLLDEKDRLATERAERQLDATLELAKAAAGNASKKGSTSD